MKMKRILNIDLAVVASQWFAKRWFITSPPFVILPSEPLAHNWGLPPPITFCLLQSKTPFAPFNANKE